MSESSRRSSAGNRESDLIKPLRKQVSRACELCRVRRIKCDDQRPCRQCVQRGVSCCLKSRGINGSEKPASYPSALKEIESLQQRIKLLEDELQACKLATNSNASHVIPTPSDSLDGLPENTELVARAKPLTTTMQWEGIYVATPCSERRYYYGPSSAFYFISRIGAYLTKTLQQPIAERNMQPYGTSRTLADPAVEVEHDMSRTQEEFFLNLFWESYHVMLPVVRESEFRKLYASLWNTTNTRRKASPLVDIILALCLQYGYSFLPRVASSTGASTENESTMAGRRYYKRCQALLVAELETPSLVTVQCQIFSVVYLCCASFQNMAHILLATLTRTAQILGLHLEPSSDLPEPDRELRKRIWWTIATIEIKTHMKLGRPTLIGSSEVTVSHPATDTEIAMAESQLGSFGQDVTWLSYSSHLSRLVRATASIYTKAWDIYGSILSDKYLRNPYQELQVLELCAEKLTPMMAPIKDWTESVPEALRLSRSEGGRSFTTALLPIDFDAFAPLWLQKNRIVLELTYHTMVLNLYRPFISFSSSASVYTPNASRHATATVQHAMIHTHIMHQAVSETDLMNGWSEFFLWQWNATITIIGFILANPVHPSTPNARKTVDKCISICDMYGANFAVAKSAAAIARDLIERADASTSRIRNDVTGGNRATANEESQASTVTNDSMSEGLEDPGSWSDFMDWALTVDTFNSFESFYGTSTADGDTWWDTRS